MASTSRSAASLASAGSSSASSAPPEYPHRDASAELASLVLQRRVSDFVGSPALATRRRQSLQPAFSNVQYDVVQAKAFARWMNDKLSRSATTRRMITDIKGEDELNLFAGQLRDGVILINLLESVSSHSFKYFANPRSAHQKLENVNKSLTFLKTAGVDLVNIGAEDIKDGNHRLMMGLIWKLMVHYQVEQYTGGLDLLHWVQERCAKYGVAVNNFDLSMDDGKVLSCLCNELDCQPPIDIAAVGDKPVEATEHAMQVASELGIPRIIDAEDMVLRPDVNSIKCYLSYFKNKIVEREGLAGQKRASAATQATDASLADTNDSKSLLDVLPSSSSVSSRKPSVASSSNSAVPTPRRVSVASSSNSFVHSDADLGGDLGGADAQSVEEKQEHDEVRRSTIAWQSPKEKDYYGSKRRSKSMGAHRRRVTPGTALRPQENANSKRSSRTRGSRSTDSSGVAAALLQASSSSAHRRSKSANPAKRRSRTSSRSRTPRSSVMPQQSRTSLTDHTAEVLARRAAMRRSRILGLTVFATVVAPWQRSKKFPLNVAGTVADSPAEVAGFLPGDKIEKAHHKLVHTVDDLKKVLASHTTKRTLVFKVLRTVYIDLSASDKLGIGFSRGGTSRLMSSPLKISRVAHGSAAAEAAVLVHDEVRSVHGRRVNTVRQFRRELEECRELNLDTVKIQICRTLRVHMEVKAPEYLKKRTSKSRKRRSKTSKR